MSETRFDTLIGGLNDKREVVADNETWERGILIVPVYRPLRLMTEDAIQTETYTRRRFISGDRTWAIWVESGTTEDEAFDLLLANYAKK